MAVRARRRSSPILLRRRRRRPQESCQGEAKGGEDEEELSRSICGIVLSHRNSTPSSLLFSLRPSLPLSLSPSLVNRTLKLLWNDAPSALLFLKSLRLLPSFRPDSSSLSLSLLLSSRLGRPLPTLPPSPLSLSALSRRHPQRAARLLLSLPNPTLPHLNSLLHSLSTSGHIRLASSLLRILRRRIHPDAASFHAIADGWCRLKLPDRAIRFLTEMIRSGIAPNSVTYNILLKGYFRASRPDLAMAFFRQMKRRSDSGDRNCTPDVVSYTIMVHGLGLAGQVMRARKMFDEMFSRGLAPTAVSYNALIQVLCRKDGLESAKVALEEMAHEGCVPNSITYNVIMKGMCERGDLEGGVEFMKLRMSEGWKPNVQTYNILIRYLMKAGEIEKGVKLFKEMWEVGGCLPDKDTYNILINAMFVRKRREDMVMAGKFVTEMVERGLMPRRFVFNRVLNGLLLTGNQEFARELLSIHSMNRQLRKEVQL